MQVKSVKNKATEKVQSPIEWLGDFPAGWKTMPFMALFKEQKEINKKGQVQNVLSLSYGKIINRNVETNFGLLPTSFDTYQIVHPGWIIFRLTDLQNDQRSLRTGLVLDEGIITSAYLAVKPEPIIEPEYAAYLLHAYDISKVFYRMGGGVRQSIEYNDLKHMLLPVPPLDEQRKIITNINSKLREVEKQISNLVRIVKLLKEKRIALISKVMMEGLNPGIKLKKTKIPWLPKIAPNWNLRRGKFIFKYKRELNSEYQCSHVLALTLKGVVDKESLKEHSLTPTDYAGYQIFEKDDLVFKLIDLENYQTSRVGIVPRKGIMSPAYIRLVPNVRMIPRFYYWYYYMLYVKGIYNYLGMGVRSTLNQEELLNLPIPIVPIEEQENISGYLDQEIAKVDLLTKKAETHIVKLQEYRSSIIYAAVTGH